MPKTRTSQKRNDEPRPIRVLRCVQLRDDGFPVDSPTVILHITAEMDDFEYGRVADAWVSASRYEIAIAAKHHVGIVTGNLTLATNGPGKWTVTFDLREECASWPKS